ncbi:N-acetyl sugar amidotransferase [Pelagibacteraceae bacterium]|nr:N-acetyl sugar amidotransferase [Pelagibacteraceae bacterium]
MKYCKICITTSLRPNAEFNSEGVCIACEFENRNEIPNYSANKSLLEKKINDVFRNKDYVKKSTFDCVIGVSGGKDSLRQAQWVKDNLNLHPLLICCSYPPLQMSKIGGENLENLIKLGFDCEIFNPSPETSRLLSKKSFFEFGNVCKHTEKVLFSTVTRIAIEKEIPFVFWGENPSIQEGDSMSLGNDIFDANSIYKINTLSSGGDEWIINEVGKNKAAPYIFPVKELEKSNVQMLFLGPAWDDWSMYTNAAYASLSGMFLRPDEEEFTGDITNASMLDEVFTNINMMIKYFKFGFGRASDAVNEGIRKGLFSRYDAIQIAKKYDGLCSEMIIDEYCKYIDISEKIFWKNIIKWTNKDLFSIDGLKKPQAKFEVGKDFNG